MKLRQREHFRLARAAAVLLAACVLLGGTRTVSAQQWLTDANARIDQHRKADLTVRVENGAGQAAPGAAVRVQMQRHAFEFGTAVPASWINSPSPDGQMFREKVLENFNHVVFENDLKWPPWIGLWGPGFNWQNTTQALDWLDDNNLPTRGHYLSWATWSGEDAWGASQNTATLPDRLLDHITEKLTTVGDRVYEWDVINHPVGWLDDTYENRIGDGQGADGLQFYKQIVDHARSVISAPVGEGGLGGVELPLWINEDDIISGGGNADDYERIIQYLIDNDAAPDGIGFQSHFVEEWGRLSPFNRSPESLYERIDRFAALSDRLRSTEFDIDVGDDEQYQAELMRDYLTVMFSHPSMEGVTLWGFWEGSHWRPDAALYRQDWSEKPSLDAYQDLVLDEWWTDETGQTDENGELSLRAFKGDYRITATVDGEEHVVEDVALNEDGELVLQVDFGLHGDFNSDGVIDATDYTAWRDNVNAPAGTLPNDPVGGEIGAAHYATWRENYGANASPSVSSGQLAAPEPFGVWVALIGSTPLCARRRGK